VSAAIAIGGRGTVPGKSAGECRAIWVFRNSSGFSATAFNHKNESFDERND